MKKKLRDIHGHLLDRDHIKDIFYILDKDLQEQKIKVAIGDLGACGQKTILIHKGEKWLSRTQWNKLKDFIYLSRIETIEKEDLTEILYGRR